MKIGILTQPLHNNYGGLLQAFALQKVLTKFGHEVLTVDLLPKKNNVLKQLKGFIAKVIRKYILKKNIHYFSENEKQYISQHTNRFIRENIKMTDTIKSVKQIYQLKKHKFDSYIVGSDQVWRPCYSPDIPTFFLNFIKKNNNIKKISYAASFGVDNWEFKIRLTRKCRKLAQNFDAISVREDTGIKLCKEYLGVNAIQVLDPTLLLDKEEYSDLIKKENIPAKTNSLMLYLLDQTPEKVAIAEKVKQLLNLDINSVMPKKNYYKDSIVNIDQYTYPPVTKWLRGFMDAEFVVTDSFHGTVFSIIFNKPFIVISNKKRGQTRFNSLLNTFNLNNRMITSINELSDKIIANSIDWSKINDIHRIKRIESINFISENLEDN